LGTRYSIEIKTKESYSAFKEENCVGTCESYSKRILICDPLSLDESWKSESYQTIDNYLRETLRHELLHAFLNESGLKDDTLPSDCWSKNEEMIDWFAVMSPKIFQAYQSLDCL
jgi:hypothetical protein